MNPLSGYELKPCPFCGGTKFGFEYVGIDNDYICITCSNLDCNATGPLDLGVSGAVEKWNERKAQEVK